MSALKACRLHLSTTYISGLGYKVPHKVEETKKKNECAEGVSSLGNGIPRGVKTTSTRAEVSSNTSRVDSKVSHSEFKTPPQRPAEDQYHTFDGVSSRQMPIPHKDVVLNIMSLYSALDLVNGYYRILMWESDIPLPAVTTPIGMLWEWLVIPQGLSNAPATFDRLVTQLFRPLRTFALTYTNTPHLSKRMARWLSFLAEYNFRVEYKPGKLNVLADALSRRPDYELAHVSRVTTVLYDRIRLAYQEDENYTPLVQFLSDGKDAKVDRFSPR
ncbi:Pol protein [Phytophthora palmivora]|uniref:Pol protein n=1 Tax=Phytophthora palmivora TaxID=4796 RepID=A0A2P4WW19_9STRA|nr:Pol protein [Phytophthora palmivora]